MSDGAPPNQPSDTDDLAAQFLQDLIAKYPKSGLYKHVLRKGQTLCDLPDTLDAYLSRHRFRLLTTGEQADTLAQAQAWNDQQAAQAAEGQYLVDAEEYEQTLNQLSDEVDQLATRLQTMTALWPADWHLLGPFREDLADLWVERFQASSTRLSDATMEQATIVEPERVPAQQFKDDAVARYEKQLAKLRRKAAAQRLAWEHDYARLLALKSLLYPDEG
jgi:hypothetical protein